MGKIEIDLHNYLMELEDDDTPETVECCLCLEKFIPLDTINEKNRICHNCDFNPREYWDELTPEQKINVINFEIDCQNKTLRKK
jgi:hypothetical protein